MSFERKEGRRSLSRANLLLRTSTEPPDNHDFLVLISSILPLSPDVRQLGLGQRTFSWTMILPEKQACDCRYPHEPFGIPSSYTHQHFRTSYRVELVAKKTGRLAKSEK